MYMLREFYTYICIAATTYCIFKTKSYTTHPSIMLNCHPNRLGGWVTLSIAILLISSSLYATVAEAGLALSRYVLQHTQRADVEAPFCEADHATQQPLLRGAGHAAAAAATDADCNPVWTNLHELMEEPVSTSNGRHSTDTCTEGNIQGKTKSPPEVQLGVGMENRHKDIHKPGGDIHKPGGEPATVTDVQQTPEEKLKEGEVSTGPGHVVGSPSKQHPQTDITDPPQTDNTEGGANKAEEKEQDLLAVTQSRVNPSSGQSVDAKLRSAKDIDKSTADTTPAVPTSSTNELPADEKPADSTAGMDVPDGESPAHIMMPPGYHHLTRAGSTAGMADRDGPTLAQILSEDTAQVAALSARDMPEGYEFLNLSIQCSEH
eukprot:GHVQ01018803.1.p1 GENE.GHVQ01018803.1~~GHVQ01018803.1.p1  ORF type:complete len:376 (+),score=75.25 GHVQ01018803.1:67-1194(+)